MRAQTYSFSTNPSMATRVTRRFSEPVTIIKCALMGGGAQGKSALTLRYITDTFLHEYEPTIEGMYGICGLLFWIHFPSVSLFWLIRNWPNSVTINLTRYVPQERDCQWPIRIDWDSRYSGTRSILVDATSMDSGFTSLPPSICDQWRERIQNCWYSADHNIWNSWNQKCPIHSGWN